MSWAIVASQLGVSLQRLEELWGTGGGPGGFVGSGGDGAMIGRGADGVAGLVIVRFDR